MKSYALYLRTTVLGISDSLVSTVGILAGVVVAGAPRETVILTGVVYAFVEAFSMAVGSFLSEESFEEYLVKHDVADSPAFVSALIMFAVFVVSSLLLLMPYLVMPIALALPVSIVLAVVALFAASAVSARAAEVPMLRRGLRMALLGGGAILIGVLIGGFFPIH